MGIAFGLSIFLLLFGLVAMIAGFIFIVVNLAVDLLLPILDPRIREAQV